MKKINFILSIVFFAAVSHAQTTMSASPVPAGATMATRPAIAAAVPQPDISKVLWFSETDHDFGKIPYGKPVEFDISMKNLTHDTLGLKEVKAGCGCTTPKWQHGPYAAGSNFKITVGFNGYTEGVFNKIVTVYLENGMSQVIHFHGETFKVPDAPAPANPGVQQLKPGGGQ